VDYDVSEIEQDPIAVGMTLNAPDAHARLFDLFRDAIGDRPRLNFGASGDDDELVGDNRFAGDVDLHELFAFFIECGRPHELKNVRQLLPPSCRLLCRMLSWLPRSPERAAVLCS